MDKPKISIEQIRNYLNTDLKITFEGDEHEHDFVGLDLSSDGVHLISPFGDFGRASLDKVRLICYRLSDLDKFIPELGFVPIRKLFPKWKWDEETESEKWFIDEGLQMVSATCQILKGPTLTFDRMQQLFQWHFWPFGEEGFEAGLVIDKMTYRKEASNV
jgi:hypothetical protein